MKFALEYYSGIDPKWALVWSNVEDGKMEGNVLSKAHTNKVMGMVYYEQAHTFVLINLPIMVLWLVRYNNIKEVDGNFLPFRHWVKDIVVDAFGVKDIQ